MLRNRIVHMLAFALVMSTVSAVARAGDREFDAVVKHISREYHGKKQGGFALGLAGLAVKFAHPAGVKSIKLAVFEEISGPKESTGLASVVRDSLAPDWKPIVRVYSRNEREQTYVYVRPHGDDDVDIFVVAIDDEDATVVKARVDVNSLGDWLASSKFLDIGNDDEH